MKKIVSTKSLTKIFGRKNNLVTGLDNINLDVFEGEFLELWDLLVLEKQHY